MKMTVATDNVLRGPAQDTLAIVVRSTDDELKTTKLPILLMPSFKRNIFSSLAEAKKCVKIVIENNGSSLDLGSSIL